MLTPPVREAGDQAVVSIAERSERDNGRLKRAYNRSIGDAPGRRITRVSSRRLPGEKSAFHALLSWPASMQQTNFGRNVEIAPQQFYTPSSENEVLAVLDRHKGRGIRCVGKRHSWSRVLVSEDVLLDLRHLNQVEPQQHVGEPSVRVGAGCQIKRLLAELRRLKQWTLPSVGFITEQTVAGAIATGTHGSGRHSLSHYVTSARVARYDRDSGQAVIEEITGGDELRAVRCSLGCTGVILSLTMRCRDLYAVEEHFQEYPALRTVLDAETEFPLQQFYLVPWRWTYFAQHRREVGAPASRTRSLYQWYRFLVFDIAMHLLILFVVRIVRMHAAIRTMFRTVVPACVIRNWRVIGASSGQLVMEHELFRHVEIELFVQGAKLDAALHFLKNTLETAGGGAAVVDPAFQSQLESINRAKELAELRGIYCHHYPICVRKILPDDTLISMASNADEVASSNGDIAATPPSGDAWYSITLTNYHRGRARNEFERLAKFLASSMSRLFEARPHWGKLCPMPPDELRELYPAFGRFARVCSEVDPHRKFSNAWTSELLDEVS